MALAGATTPVSITVDGESGEHLAFAREIQWDPVRSDLVHVDFLRTEATERISAEAPVVLEGESAGARAAFGTVVQMLRTVTVEALPLDMPREILVDAAVLDEPDSVLRAGDLPIPAAVTLLTDSEEMVARVEAGRAPTDAPAAPQAEAPSGEAEPTLPRRRELLGVPGLLRPVRSSRRPLKSPSPLHVTTGLMVHEESLQSIKAHFDVIWHGFFGPSGSLRRPRHRVRLGPSPWDRSLCALA